MQHQWLTPAEFIAKFKIGTATLERMIKAGKLDVIRLRKTRRILDPSPLYIQRAMRRDEAVNDIPFIRKIEFAEICGVTPRRIRQWQQMGRFKGWLEGGSKNPVRVVSVNDIRDALMMRYPNKIRGGIRQSVVRWARKAVEHAIINKTREHHEMQELEAAYRASIARSAGLPPKKPKRRSPTRKLPLEHGGQDIAKQG